MSQAHPRCAVVGAANIDIGGFPSGALVPRDSNPGRVALSAGGVGRNIACGLARLGVETHLVAALGADAFAGLIRADCARAGVALDLALEFPEAASSAYLYVADASGDMAVAINDMAICGRLTPEALESRLGALSVMDAVVLDANLSAEALEYLAANLTVPLVADAVSAVKAPRLLPILPRLAAIKPNDLEAEALTGIAVDSVDGAARAARRLVELGAAQAFITMGKRGVCCADAAGVEYLPGCALSGPSALVSATGAGDAFTAALVWNLLRGRSDLRSGALAGTAAAALTMESEETVAPSLSEARLLERVARLAAPDGQP